MALARQTVALLTAALHLVRDPETAEDVTQEAFLLAYRSLGRFRGQSKFSTWLYRIARNCAVDAIRRRERRRRLERQSAPETFVPDPSLRAALAAAIDRLPPDLREAFVVIEVFGLPYAEAGRVLGVLPAGRRVDVGHPGAPVSTPSASSPPSLRDRTRRGQGVADVGRAPYRTEREPGQDPRNG